MSYVSGFMMGAAIGKSIRQALGGGAPKMSSGRVLPQGKMRRVAAAIAPAPVLFNIVLFLLKT